MFSEWTGTLIKFLKDQLSKLQEWYHLGTPTPSTPNSNGTPNGSCSNNTPNSSSTSANTANGTVNNQPSTPNSNSQPTTGTVMSEEHKLAQKQWHYCTLLARYMFEEGLLDRQELLQWILELLDKMKSAPSDDGILKLLLPLALQYLDEFVQLELLSRRMAYLCCKKIAHMCSNVDTSFNPQSPLIIPPSKPEINGKENPPPPAVINPLKAAFKDYLSCPHHRDIIYQLSAIIQVNTIFYFI